MRIFLSLTTMALSVAASMAQAGCADQEEACEIDGGTYHITLPDGAGDQTPAIMFIHGWGSSGQGVLRNTGMVNAAKAKGYAIIAPDGMPREGRDGRSWSFHPQLPNQREEVPFLTAVRDDAITKHSIDPDRMILAGFSIGGSMTSYLACAAPDSFTAYAPVGGGFWRPHPEGCAGPVKLLHTHGWTDGTVPLEGRVLRGDNLQDPAALAQGDIFHTMLLWRRVNGCENLRATEFDMGEDFWRRRWTKCSDDTALELALFPGGHRVPNGWATMAIDWFEGLPGS
ncbi:PHB depolymerase family esterase [Actibacterium sp. 188UL27-1]|uniref:alpha/beta hydrolase family esterase n=1 Tax=Actibacterium sp. 188UL27-1 TaxID=2786961 RepID=UPI0019569D9F|nr:PHB depolymerase family esterase [Actibacterium sp. 188UL27-1]MBM7066139.1 prolyl oligopeptidase family serine peptidase [Actibacterium sp. 188UL27-1]